MDEVKSNDLKPVHYLMIVTVFFYGSLVLFLKLKGNFPTNPLWPFIRLGCKWSLFSWMFYGGVIYGKKLVNKPIKPLEENLQFAQTSLKKTQMEREVLQEYLQKSEQSRQREKKEFEQIEKNLLEKVKQYERTAEDVTGRALKNFL